MEDYKTHCQQVFCTGVPERPVFVKDATDSDDEVWRNFKH